MSVYYMQLRFKNALPIVRAYMLPRYSGVPTTRTVARRARGLTTACGYVAAAVAVRDVIIATDAYLKQRRCCAVVV